MTPSRSPASNSRHSTIPNWLAFTGAAVTFTSVYLATGALTPMLVVYREEWHFPATQLALAFAVYAVGFLAALLTLGSLSDYVGRRPVLVGALVIQVVSNLMFLFAPDITWVIAGRIVQGVAQGAATAAFTAALVELAPPNRKRLGAILGSVGVTGGLALGSLLAGLAIQLTPHANSVVFGLLIPLTVLGGVAVTLSPETVTPAPGALRSLIPRISIPPAARGEFAAAAPVLAAIWMLAGLSGGLAPSMVQTVFHLDSGLLNGFTGFVAPAASAIVGLAFANVGSRRAMTIGIYASIAGAATIIGGVLFASLTMMIGGQIVAGIGFGASFTAALRLILPLAEPNQRAGVASATYVVSYLAFGVPIVIVGELTDMFGVIWPVVSYSTVAVLLAFISLAAQHVLPTAAGQRRPDDKQAPKTPSTLNQEGRWNSDVLQ
jgi:MFS family permease